MEGVLGMGPGPAGGESSMDGKSRDVEEVVGKERGQMGWCGGLGIGGWERRGSAQSKGSFL